MPLAAKFDADFESFHREVVKADGHLKGLQTTSMQTAKSWDQLSTSGGGAFRNVQQGLAQVDRTLAQVGINVGPQIGMFGELAGAVGKTTAQFGYLGTAALAFATFMATYKFTEWALGFAGVHDAVADTAVQLGLFGDVAAETAAYKTDLLVKATRIAEREITDLGEAVKIVEQDAKQHAASLVTWRERVSKYQREIAGLRKSGDLEALTQDMASHVMTTQEVADKYGITVQALQYFQRATKEQAERQNELNTAMAATQKLAGTMIGQDAIDKAGQYLQAITSLKSQGLEPMKTSWGDIATVLGTAMRAMEETGRTGETMYGKLQAAQRHFLGQTAEGLLQSRNLAVGLAQAPSVAVDAWTKGALQIAYANQQASEDSTAWWEQYRKEQDKIVAMSEDRIEAMAQTVPATHGGMVDELGAQWQGYAGQVQQAAQQATMTWQQAMDAVRRGQGTLGGTVQQGGPFKATREQIQRAAETGRYYGPVTPSGQPDYVKLGYDRPVINVDARDSFYDSNAGVQKLADKVGAAIMAKLRSQGSRA